MSANDRRTRSNCDAAEVADLVLQLGRAAYAGSMAGGLTQAQWVALRFFSRANRFSRTVSGFADFHATTRGTASQTVKSLVAKGFLVRHRSARDGRSARFDLTPLGRRRLDADPLEDVVRAVGRLTETRQSHLAAGLRAAVGELARSRCGGSTGVCRLCGHLEADGAGGNRCRLLRESLRCDELGELCVRFDARS
jgi:DNA-binding MarR family transcriptional regulator